jgi:hypothetical protein
MDSRFIKIKIAKKKQEMAYEPLHAFLRKGK